MQELTFGNEELQLVVLPTAGARIHRLSAFGRDLLRTPDDPAQHLAEPLLWGAYVMAPWCNRLQAGPMQFDSRPLELTPNFPDGTAIHGEVYASRWSVQPDGSVVIQAGGEQWPWRYEVSERVALEGTSLRLMLALTNRDDGPMPGGIGIHPWFLRPDAVAIHANEVFPNNLQTDADPLPVSGPLDLRTPRTMPPGVDATWAGLSDPAVGLSWQGVQATMRVHATQAFIVAASPHDVDAVAIEAQTHAPDGLRRLINGEPAEMAMLNPEETLSLTVQLDFAEPQH